MKINTIVVGDALTELQKLPDEVAQCCVTSPPYWGLRSYLPDDHPDKPAEIGLEKTMEEYIETMVEVFREVRRVLRKDATLWLNLGDSYAGSGCGSRDPEKWPKQSRNDHRVAHSRNPGAGAGLKAKDLIGMPWRVALALQADGWWLRSDIVWAKPSPMPESVRDRPTRAHEYVFLMTRAERYFYDADAIRERLTHPKDSTPDDVNRAFNRRRDVTTNPRQDHLPRGGGISADDYEERKWKDRSDGLSRPPMTMKDRVYHPLGRNARTVWTIASQPTKLKHFASFPEALASRCIRAGTSQRGACRKCGAPWERETSKHRIPDRPGRRQTIEDKSLLQGHGADHRAGRRHNTEVTTTGWAPGCKCGHTDVKLCLVVDCFMGSGVSARVSRALGRSWWGCDLNPDYVAMAMRRTGRPALGPSETEDLPLFDFDGEESP